MEVSGQFQVLAAYLGKEVPVGGPQSRSERLAEDKILSSLSVFEPVPQVQCLFTVQTTLFLLLHSKFYELGTATP